jgi:hypothetical protein
MLLIAVNDLMFFILKNNPKVRHISFTFIYICINI